MSEITPNTPNPVREDAYVEELATKLGIDPQYIPKSPVWRNEEEIRAIAEMFANMAGGSSGGGVLVVHDVNGTLDKTWQEIHDALLTGGAVIAYSDQNAKAISQVGYPDIGGSYYVDAGSMYYAIGAADGYPVYNDE